MNVEATCSIEGCENPRKARGMCDKHWFRWRKTVTLPTTTEERFWEKVNKDGPIPEWDSSLGRCWVWLGATQKGYAEFRSLGENVRGHRYSYELLVGPIPDGLVIDHLCHVRNCVNPAHLQPVTFRENLVRGLGPAGRARSATCKRGHPLSGSNLRPASDGRRRCKACALAARLKRPPPGETAG